MTTDLEQFIRLAAWVIQPMQSRDVFRIQMRIYLRRPN